MSCRSHHHLQQARGNWVTVSRTSSDLSQVDTGSRRASSCMPKCGCRMGLLTPPPARRIEPDGQ